MKELSLSAICGYGFTYKLSKINVKEGITLIQKAQLFYEKTNDQAMLKETEIALKD